jgi:hypothetical protein
MSATIRLEMISQSNRICSHRRASRRSTLRDLIRGDFAVIRSPMKNGSDSGSGLGADENPSEPFALGASLVFIDLRSFDVEYPRKSNPWRAAIHAGLTDEGRCGLIVSEAGPLNQILKSEMSRVLQLLNKPRTSSAISGVLTGSSPSGTYDFLASTTRTSPGCRRASASIRVRSR